MLENTEIVPGLGEKKKKKEEEKRRGKARQGKEKEDTQN